MFSEPKSIGLWSYRELKIFCIQHAVLLIGGKSHGQFDTIA